MKRIIPLNNIQTDLISFDKNLLGIDDLKNKLAFDLVSLVQICRMAAIIKISVFGLLDSVSDNHKCSSQITKLPGPGKGYEWQSIGLYLNINTLEKELELISKNKELMWTDVADVLDRHIKELLNKTAEDFLSKPDEYSAFRDVFCWAWARFQQRIF